MCCLCLLGLNITRRANSVVKNKIQAMSTYFKIFMINEAESAPSSSVSLDDSIRNVAVERKMKKMEAEWNT